MSVGPGAAAVLEVVMPRLSDSMEDGKILAWLKQSGETVVAGDELAEIETDKATVVYEADDEGVLEVVAGEGTSVPIGTVIARLHPVGAGIDTPAPSAPPAPPRRPPAAPRRRPRRQATVRPRTPSRSPALKR